MADEPNPKASSWSDREKLTYIVGLMEASGAKLNHKDAPHPPGRTTVACLLMTSKLKASLKKELEAWKTSEGHTVAAEKLTTTSRKRKTNDTENDGEPAPKKRGGGRKKKGVEEHVLESHDEIKQECKPDNEFI